MPSQMPAILQAVMKGQSKALADAHYEPPRESWRLNFLRKR